MHHLVDKVGALYVSKGWRQCHDAPLCVVDRDTNWGVRSHNRTPHLSLNHSLRSVELRFITSPYEPIETLQDGETHTRLQLMQYTT